MKLFHICTIANDLDQYREMKKSFLLAGFDEDWCRYSLLDNSSENRHEPYSAFNRMQAETTEPYIIFCHQDIRLSLETGYEKLLSLIDRLTQEDHTWAIAGNAGVGEDNTIFLHVKHPNGTVTCPDLPKKVRSLDENFLLVRTDRKLYCSSNLGGFHLYATDLCLNAHSMGSSAYIIDFLLTHLSTGNATSPDFRRSTEQFDQFWRERFVLHFVRTPCVDLYLSRYDSVRRMMRNKRIQRMCRAWTRLRYLLQKKSRLIKPSRSRSLKDQIAQGRSSLSS